MRKYLSLVLLFLLITCDAEANAETAVYSIVYHKGATTVTIEELSGQALLPPRGSRVSITDGSNVIEGEVRSVRTQVSKLADPTRIVFKMDVEVEDPLIGAE